MGRWGVSWVLETKAKNKQQQKANAGVLPLRQAHGENDKYFYNYPLDLG